MLSPARSVLLVGSLLAVTLHAFDELAVTTVLPVIADDLGGRSLYGAVFFAYLLASLVGLVIGGGESTRRGPARPFALGLAIFASGLVASALAPGMEALVLGRALQGLGGGIVSATVYVVINRGFDDGERPRVLALQASAWVVPALIAPAAAGALVDHASWRWVFAGLLPLVVLALALGVPSMRRLGAGTPGPGARAELLDGLRLAAGLGLVLLALARPVSARELVAVACGVALAGPPLRRALPEGVVTARPMLPAAVAFKILLVFAFFGTEAFVPLALIEIHGLSPLQAGLTLTGAALCWTSGAHLQASLVSRFGMRALGLLGAACVLVAIAAMAAMLDPATPVAVAFAAWALSGFGMGLAYLTATASAMAHTPAGREGSTSTALGIADAVAISIATGLGGAVIAAGERATLETRLPLAWIWGGMALVACLAVATALRLEPRAPEPVADELALTGT